MKWPQGGLWQVSARESTSKPNAAMGERPHATLAALDRTEPFALVSQQTYRLHPLKENSVAQLALAVSRTRRFGFCFGSGGVLHIELVDYH